MTGDLNIRDSIWDPEFPHYSHHSQDLFDIADSFYLELSRPTKQIPTRYFNNQQDSNLVIDLIFLIPESSEYNNHIIHPDLRLTSDHALLTINISIFEEQIITRCMLIKNSNEENKFINNLIENIKGMNTLSICNKVSLNKLSKNLPVTWKEHGINIQKLLTSLSI